MLSGNMADTYEHTADPDPVVDGAAPLTGPPVTYPLAVVEELTMFPSYKLHSNSCNFLLGGALYAGDKVICVISAGCPFQTETASSSACEFDVSKYDAGKTWVPGGTCVISVDKVLDPTDPSVSTTADIALLRLRTEHVVSNTFRLPCPDGNFRNFKIRRSQRSAQEGDKVLLRNQDGQVVNGQVIRYFDDKNDAGGLKNVLMISESDANRVPITRKGDCGALVLSCPIFNSNGSPESDILFVYGVAIGIKGNHSTVACDLTKVLNQVLSNHSPYPTSQMFEGIPPTVLKNLDFLPVPQNDSGIASGASNDLLS